MAAGPFWVNSVLPCYGKTQRYPVLQKERKYNVSCLERIACCSRPIMESDTRVSRKNWLKR
jgi:hypothetical protein